MHKLTNNYENYNNKMGNTYYIIFNEKLIFLQNSKYVTKMIHKQKIHRPQQKGEDCRKNYIYLIIQIWDNTIIIY